LLLLAIAYGLNYIGIIDLPKTTMTYLIQNSMIYAQGKILKETTPS